MTASNRKGLVKPLLTVITIAALLMLTFAVRRQLAETVRNLRWVNLWLVVLILPLQLLNYHAQAKLYGHFFAILGTQLRYRLLYRLSLEVNLVNNAFPTAGVSGFSYLGLRLRHEGVTTARATIAHLMKFVFIFVTYEAYLFVGLVLLAAVGQANDFLVLIAGSLATLLAVGTGGVAFVIGSRQRINGFFTFLTKALNQLIHAVRPRHPETINILQARQAFDDLHDNYHILQRNRAALKRPLMYAALANLTEIASVYVVFAAFGHWINPGAIIMAYAVANFAGLVSVLPGGVGIYEVLMTGVLAAGGVPAAVSLPAIVMYRIVNLAIQLPSGFYFYHRAIGRMAPPAGESR